MVEAVGDAVRTGTAGKPLAPWVRFDRNEVSGAFGDIGTDFPLIVGMILAAGLDVSSALVLFGVMQILTGLTYGIPMPAQPLKAMAVIVITQKLGGDVLFGGGLAIGVAMLVLGATGLVDVLARLVPKVVVRGIQFALGLQLAALAVGDYVQTEGEGGYVLAGLCFVMIVALLGNRRYPPAPFAILLGIAYALLFRLDIASLTAGVGFDLPLVRIPSRQDVWSGLILLAVPQLPLSLGNSVLATKQIAADLFPEQKISARKISLTYAAMNLINPFFGGIPTCHGSGGMAGHHAFGGRTGGSVILYGSLYLIVGLFLSGSFSQVILLFPKPVLGVILLFEAIALLLLARDVLDRVSDLSVVFLVAIVAVNMPYGYLVAMVLGAIVARLVDRDLAGMRGQ